MSPFEKLISGYYTLTITRVSSVQEREPIARYSARPEAGRRDSVGALPVQASRSRALGKAKTFTRESSRWDSETFTRESLGPPGDGITDSTEGPA